MTHAVAQRHTPLAVLLSGSRSTVRELLDASVVDAQARRAHRALLQSEVISLRRAMLRDYFNSLHHQWRDATGFSSSLADMRADSSYTAIVALGDEAIPLILEHLERRPGLILMALHDITGEDPVSQEHRGRVPQMVQDWLQWGVEHGYRH